MQEERERIGAQVSLSFSVQLDYDGSGGGGCSTQCHLRLKRLVIDLSQKKE